MHKNNIRKTGNYLTIGELRYFIPNPLPPTDPELLLTPELITLYGEATFALGQLNEMSIRLPDPLRFIRAYVIKEALLTSAIEGVHTTLVDIFSCGLHDFKPNKDTQLVLQYTNALNTALDMMQAQNFPLAARVILAAHEALLWDERGKAPGQYRKQSVRVGELVPPPPTEISNLMSDLEKYIHENSETPPLIKAGLVHVQFEAIHPFLDGNGRIGRLLIVLMLINDGLLKLPILYPSYYFKKHHLQYYQTLDSVRTAGDFEGWVAYFLMAVRDSAQDAYGRVQKIEQLEYALKSKIRYSDDFAKMRDTAGALLDYLFCYPVTNVTQASEKIGKTYNTTARLLSLFTQLNIVSENIVNKRNKIYHFEPYLALLE